MVRWASENGYDKIAWTTGEQQAARYDLSKQVSSIYIVDNGKGGVSVGAQPYGSTNFETIATDIPTDKLTDYVGKDIGRKFVETGQREFTGLDLKVGGEGMKGFYDKIIPEYMNKFGKKWGTKVEEIKIKTGYKWNYEIERDQSNKYVIRGPNGLATGHEIDVKNLSLSVARFDTYQEAHRARTELAEFAGMFEQPVEQFVHSLDITPSMRESAIKEGLPLFQLVPPVAAGAGLVGERLMRKESKKEEKSP
jgi:hypothetical protein